ncbi:MAG: deoxyribonuclease-like protein [Methanolobus sp.]|uniref:exonuclease/endonuclease/phosphatase family protein n=1 Tax=Methanolobus sp. TaxID=1874737 RepID=UPI0024AB0499|nr:endonuclease/exonuclease/phosphatase family protein [Methanolobus sp.]MDI3487099.1 deoxyribonuclease-like protein [Methanolobus sp.]MDK2831993.1 deoxyribonuclease-like protein [Methanolobus sp.]MDK2940446.1 deoxyribonuclease-like protein [Methanolobus sp.]
MHKPNIILFITLVTLIILACVSSGCLSDPESKLPETMVINDHENTNNISDITENNTIADEYSNDHKNFSEESQLTSVGDIEENTNIETAPEPEPVTNNVEMLKIGSFNIQVFGVTKAGKTEVMETIVKIVHDYDIIAIQEIRDASQTSLPALMDMVNSDGYQYDYVISERLGRTSSKEQYAYIFNTDTVEITGDPQTYPEANGTDPFHREPFIAAFSSTEGNFDAVFMVIHTDPDEATEEINALDDVLEYSQNEYPHEKDFIILGDLNADGSYFDEDSTNDLDTYEWIINNSVDTTTKSTDYSYDRIILTDSSDFTGNSGVFRFDLEYGLDYNETVAVSDHYPVYAEFIAVNDED